MCTQKRLSVNQAFVQMGVHYSLTTISDTELKIKYEINAFSIEISKVLNSNKVIRNIYK